ncbi:MAG TPA: transporter [Myxococcales bacterium]|nr:transporter [Myxococcales bacterium]
MREIFAAIVPWATLVYAVSSMLSVGLGHSFSKIIGPLKNWPWVLLALAANFLLAPALAYLLDRAFGLDVPHAVGLFLIGSAAGAPFLLKLTQVARGRMALAASLLVLLLPLTVVFVPLVLPTVLPEAHVSAGAIARPLVFSMLLPLAGGMSLRPVAPGFAARASRPLGDLATVALVVLLASIVVADWPELIGIGARAILAAFVFILGAFLIGLALGARHRERRTVLAFGTAQRNIAAATVVATQTFETLPSVVVMVTAAAVLGMLLLFPLAFAFRWLAAHPATAGFLRRRHA